MSCMEVWGGSQLTERSVEFGGLDAWVFSKPYGDAPRGGDVYYASSCATGRITRVLLADVAGHGTSVAAAAADLRLLMRRFVNCLDQTEFVRSINRHFLGLWGQAIFATAVVTTFFAPTRRLSVCNAGHPLPLIYRPAQRQWDFLNSEASAAPAGPRNLPLGILGISDYDVFDVELAAGDCVVYYTDALIESQDADGEMLGEAGLLRIVRLLGETDAAQLIAVLLGEIRERYPDNLSHDDVTVLVLRVSKRQPHYSFGEKLSALGRLFGSVIRAVNPRAERPPFPDFNLANIGGAIIPALARRWRGAGASRRSS
ncbi:MAG TPA: PP2C family protein-serine/threonine phosphatase [Terriglobia bacterium]|nr:PP2C family protein-serine/threonine phosphatase [Terriglobia bacterium]